MPKLSLVKLGCPGETTTMTIHGGRCTHAMGSQLDEAIAFLQAHRRSVAFVTIDIGANDFPCQDASCVPAGLASVQANLPEILGALRAAAGPDIPIVGVTIYNPFLGAWLLVPQGQAFAVQSAQLVGGINALLRAIYAATGTRNASVEVAFQSTDFATLVARCWPSPVGRRRVGYSTVIGRIAKVPATRSDAYQIS